MKKLTTHTIIAALAILIIVLTFALQSYNVGFWGWRHGWTSSHSLSIIRRAVPENRFVGYALAFEQQDGSIDYEYFDRYPVFFSAITNGVLSLVDDIPTQIYVARQYMNVILLLTMFAAYRLVRLYIDNRFIAFSVTVLSFSSYYFLYYKDMPDFHPPVVLGFLATCYSIARYKLHGERWQVYLVSLASVMLAFGYAIMFLLALWFVVDAIRVLVFPVRTQHTVSLPSTSEREGTDFQVPLSVYGEGDLGGEVKWGFRERVLTIFRLDALWICILGTVLSAGAILYNVSAEAALRGVSIRETSVIDSILRRIPFLEGAVSEVERDAVALSGITGWLQFFVVEFERVIKWSLPLKTGGETGIRFVPGESQMQVTWWIVITGIPLTALLIRFIWKQHGAKRDVALLTAFAPVVFLFTMINLTSVHDFVTMFAMGFSVMLWTALFSVLPLIPQPLLPEEKGSNVHGRSPSPWGEGFRVRGQITLLVLASITLYTASNLWVRHNQQIELIDGAPYTYDFERIRHRINGENNTIYLDYYKEAPQCVIRDWQCFALGYYLGDNTLTIYPELADYVLSPRPYYTSPRFVDNSGEVMLTTAANIENDVTYLLDLSTAEPITAPDTDNPVFVFGDVLEMDNWQFTGNTNAHPCEWVMVTSWWRVDSVPDANYNMQIVMVDANGGAVTESNLPLGSVPTKLWETGHWTLDARPLQIPCDTAPGEYPLIMGAYHPDTLQPLGVVAGGKIIGNQVYLTTLVIE